MLYIRPHQIDYRKLQNAKEDLYTRLAEVVRRLESVYSHNQVGIGFLDETQSQNRASTQRVWAFGYYAYRGNSCLVFSEDATSNSVCKALEEIRRVNEDKKVVIVILDNFTFHKSSKVRQVADMPLKPLCFKTQIP